MIPMRQILFRDQLTSELVTVSNRIAFTNEQNPYWIASNKGTEMKRKTIIKKKTHTPINVKTKKQHDKQKNAYH